MYNNIEDFSLNRIKFVIFPSQYSPQIKILNIAVVTGLNLLY